MKKLINQSVPTLLLLVTLNLSVLAQEKLVTTSVASSCNNEAALTLIQQQLAESKTFDDVGRRITVVTRAADLLWPYQEEKSRAGFVEAFELATQHFKEQGDDPKREGVGLMISTPDMRYTVISSIAKRDPAWANKLMEALLNDQVNEAKEKQDAARDSSTAGRTSEKLLTIATSLLASDHAAALMFAGQSLRFPATFYLPMFLYKFAEVNPVAADQFYQTALAAYAGAPMDRLLYLSSYPFGNDREVGEMPGYTIYKVHEGFTPNTNLQRLLIQTILRRVQEQIARPADQITGSRLSEPEQMWLALSRLDRQIAKSLPDLAPAVEQAKIGLSGQLPETSQKRVGGMLTKPKGPQGTFAEQVEAAEKNPDVDRRDQLLVFAVMGAPETQDLDVVLSVVNKISDSKPRAQLLNWLYFSRAQSAIKKKQLAQARTLGAKVEELDQRGFLYFRIAEESLKESVDQTQARGMLEEVVAAAAKSPATMVSARTQLGVAHLYTKIDAARAIAVLSDAIKTINSLESPDFSRQFVMRRIEGKTFGSYASFVTPGFNPETALLEISKTDFDGTLYQANNFTSKPLRALTTLAVIEPCLKVSTQPGKPTRKPKASKAKP